MINVYCLVRTNADLSDGYLGTIGTSVRVFRKRRSAYTALAIELRDYFEWESQTSPDGQSETAQSILHRLQLRLPSGPVVHRRGVEALLAEAVPYIRDSGELYWDAAVERTVVES